MLSVWFSGEVLEHKGSGFKSHKQNMHRTHISNDRILIILNIQKTNIYTVG